MRNNRIYPSLPQAWVIFGIFLAASIGTGLVIGVVHEAIHAESVSLGNLIGYTFSMLFVILFAWRNKTGGRRARVFYFKSSPLLSYPLLVILTLALAVVLDPLTNLIPMPEIVEELFALLATKDIYTLLMVCIIGPILEEVLFRGLILDGFLNRYGAVKAIFWSAFLFGLFHLNPWQFIPGFTIGLFLGWLYLKTRSLVPVILVHMVNNSLSYTLMYIYGSEINSFKDLFEEPGNYLVFFLSSCALLILSLYLLIRILRYYNHTFGGIKPENTYHGPEN